MLSDLIKQYKLGKISEKKLLSSIENIKYNEYFSSLDNEFNFDNYRQGLTGIPEVVLAKSKTPEDLKKIVFTKLDQRLLFTKINQDKFEYLKKNWQEKMNSDFPFVYNQRGKILFSSAPQTETVAKGILVLSGGTSDLDVVEEVKCSLLFFKLECDVHNDVGIAGLKRILHIADTIKKAKVIITVAGMEAALPSVVASLTKAPIISVPTSTGYYGHFEGLTALLSMLGSCSPGIAVVNIDNGFGAAALAWKVLNVCEKNH